MSFNIDFRTLPENVPTLCIPRVYSNISESRIRKIFEELDMGTLERIDIVKCHNTLPAEKFNRVYIHFARWNNSENACIARERLLNGKEIKIIYDDPWFWKISAYRSAPRPVDKPVNRNPKAFLKLDDDKPIPACFQVDEREKRIMSKLTNGLSSSRNPRHHPQTNPRHQQAISEERRDNPQVILPEPFDINYGDITKVPPRRRRHVKEEKQVVVIEQEPIVSNVENNNQNM